MILHSDPFMVFTKLDIFAYVQTVWSALWRETIVKQLSTLTVVMPFGLTKALAVFQNLINDV